MKAALESREKGGGTEGILELILKLHSYERGAGMRGSEGEWMSG